VDGITVGTPYTIQTQPRSQIANAGSNVLFSVVTTGLPTTYQWRKNGVALAGSTGPTLSLSSVTSASGGDYTCLIGGVTSTAAAKLIVVTPGLVQRPKQTGTAVLKVTPSFTTGVTYAWYTPADTLITNVTGRYSGATTATLTVSNCSFADEGLYTCRVTAFTPSQTLVSSPVELDVVTLPVIDVSPLGAPPVGTVGRSYSWQVLASQFPTSYTISGQASGLVVNGPAGIVSGIPNIGGSFPVTVKATNAAGTTLVSNFTLVVEALPTGTTGAFSSIIARSNAVNGGLGGTLALNVTSTGATTGTLKLGALTYTLPAGTRVRGTVGGDPTLNFTIARTAAAGGNLSVALGFNSSTQTLDGTVTNAALQSAGITGARHGWSTTGAASYAGKYNLHHVLGTTSEASASNPHGDGFTQLSIAANGVVTITGRLGDGVALVSSTATLWPDGRYPMHQLLYANKGSFSGICQITLGTGPAFQDNAATGQMTWHKLAAASATDTVYAAGFQIQDLTTTGNKWITAAPVLGRSSMRTTFAEGDISSVAQFAALNQVFTISATNVPAFPTVLAGNTTSMRFTSFSAATGLFTGTATLTDPHPVTGVSSTRNLPFYGVLNSSTLVGKGVFQLPSRPSLPAAVTAGRLLLGAP
jgi:hypothetical protein